MKIASLALAILFSCASPIPRAGSSSQTSPVKPEPKETVDEMMEKVFDKAVVISKGKEIIRVKGEGRQNTIVFTLSKPSAAVVYYYMKDGSQPLMQVSVYDARTNKPVEYALINESTTLDTTKTTYLRLPKGQYYMKINALFAKYWLSVIE